MKMVMGAALASAMALTGFSAYAGAVASCAVGSGLTCLVNKNEFGSGPSGNDKEQVVEDALAAALSLGSIDLTLEGKSDGGYGDSESGKSGDWSVPDIIDYITVKAANSFLIFDAGGSKTGNWTTMGIVNNGGNQPDLSHISYWSAGTTAIPLPAGGVLLLTGLAGLMVARRRRA